MRLNTLTWTGGHCPHCPHLPAELAPCGFLAQELQYMLMRVSVSQTGSLSRAGGDRKSLMTPRVPGYLFQRRTGSRGRREQPQTHSAGFVVVVPTSSSSDAHSTEQASQSL